MTTRIFFCGEVVADLWEQNQGSGEFQCALGGSQFNSVRGARKAILRENLNMQVAFVGPLSKDMFGDRFLAQLEKEGIDTAYIKRVDRNTTLAIVSVRPGMENAFSFYGRDTAEQMTKIEDLPQKLGDDGDKKICCFGSISTVMEPARFAWLEFARKNRSSALFMYDLNTRPSIAKDPEKYRAMVLEWAGIAHVMKASDADIAWTYPGKSLQDVADLWLSQGALMAVFTKGKEGSEIYTSKSRAMVETPALTTPSTVGAGDNFNAGFALELAKNNCFKPQDLEKLSDVALSNILHGANSTAARHLMSIGAKPREGGGSSLQLVNG